MWLPFCPRVSFARSIAQKTTHSRVGSVELKCWELCRTVSRVEVGNIDGGVSDDWLQPTGATSEASQLNMDILTGSEESVLPVAEAVKVHHYHCKLVCTMNQIDSSLAGAARLSPDRANSRRQFALLSAFSLFEDTCMYPHPTHASEPSRLAQQHDDSRRSALCVRGRGLSVAQGTLCTVL